MFFAIFIFFISICLLEKWFFIEAFVGLDDQIIELYYQYFHISRSFFDDEYDTEPLFLFLLIQTLNN